MIKKTRIQEYPEIRYCRVRKNTKKPFETDWTKKPYKWEEIQEHLKDDNYGVLCGYGNLIVIDSDTKRLQTVVENELPPTFRVKTGGGGFHNYFFCRDLNEKIVLTTNKRHWGEVQSYGTQVVGPGSIHPNGNKYIVISDSDIANIDYSQLISAISPFMKEVEDIQMNANEEKSNFKSEIDNLNVADIWGLSGLKKKGNKNEYYGSHPIHGSEGGMNFWVNPSKNIWYCFRCLSGGGPLSAIAVKEGIIECSDARSGQLRGDKVKKTLQIAKEKYGLSKISYEDVNKTQVSKNKVEVRMFKDFLKLRKDKNFFVENLIYPKTVTMLYSPPGQFKSLMSLYLAMSISTGKQWMGFKTKRYPVLYCDGENNDQILKGRLMSIYKGQNYKRKSFPLYIVKRGTLMGPNKLINYPFYDELRRIIEEKKIKLLIFDTLHRFAFYDENKSDDINTLYTRAFQPLVEEYGISIIFLHHSTKSGGYRGSGDFLGCVDTAYQILRHGKSNKFYLINEKSRAGEIEKITGEIDFGEDYIKFFRVDEEIEIETRIDKLKKVTNKILSLFQEGTFMRRKEIMDTLEIENFDYGSPKTVQRALKYLSERGNLDMDPKKKTYTLMLK